MQSRSRAFIAGAACGLISLLTMFLLRNLGLAVFLPEFAADRFFSIVPGEIESLAVTTLREYAKLSAFIGFLLGITAVYGLVGILVQYLWNRFKIESETIRLLVALAVPWIIAVLSFQILTSVGNVPEAARMSLPLIVGGYFLVHSIYGLFFSPTLRWLSQSRPPILTSRIMEQLGRRRFLVSIAGLVVVALIGVRLASLAGSKEYVEETGTIDASQSVFGRPELGGMISREITANEDFYVVSKNVFDPEVNERDWSLMIGGLVDKELVFSYDELRSLPKTKQFATLICISNEVGGNLTSNAEWTGTPLGDLLDRAHPKNNTNFVTFHCADGYTSTIPIEKAYEDGSMLAYEMNGRPLPTKHGFPLRAIIPNLYGMKNPKWIQRIELTEHEEAGYWESKGWSNTAEINTISRIDTPLNAAEIPTKTVLAGIAFAGTRGIEAVELSTDGERTWLKTALKPRLSPLAWTFWAGEWSAPKPGAYSVAVRATTDDGRIQTFEDRTPFPAGATGIHRIIVHIR